MPENLELLRRLRRVADPKAVDAVMDRLGLAPYADRRAETLSRGNRQRLGLAKALLHAPDLLILDEPADGLDPAGVAELRDLLRDLAQARGVTVFMSSHALPEVSRLATRIGVLHQGRLVGELARGDLERRSRRWLAVDARDRRAARAALAAAGFAVATGEDGCLELADERAVARPEEVARLLVESGAPPTRLCVQQEDLERHVLRVVGVEGGENGGGVDR